LGLGISSTLDVLASSPGVEPSAAPSLLPGTGGVFPATGDLSIVYVSGEPDTPGHHYRVERYAAAAAANGCTAVCIRGDELPHRLTELSDADVLVIWRMPWSEHVRAAVDQMRAHQKRVVFDVDDLMVDPDLATVQIIDGIRSQSLTEKAVRRHYGAVRETMLASDICFAATDELALHMRKAGKVAHVLPNGFDDATHKASRLAARRWRLQRQDTLIRLGYAGGTRTHQRDFGVAVEAIVRLLQEHPHCRLVLYRSPDGARPFIDIEEFPALRALAGQIEWRSLRPLSELPEEIARFDINLAPLEAGNPYCEAKSELKFFEAALVDVPTIASPTGPYRRAIEHGKTGFLAANTDDWYACGKRLIEDPALRGRVGREAYIEALARFGSTARRTQFGRVVAQLRGGIAAAHAFALDSQLSGKRRPGPALLQSETVLERDRFGVADVTVVLPLYNYEDFVTEALDSVRDQTLGDLDLVVVDDCSSDRSLSVATDWAENNAERFNRICVLTNRSNQGLARSRNAGFDAADTPFVLPLDPDNKLLPQCCETLLNTMRTSGAAFAYSTIRRFGDGDGLVSAVGYDAQRFVGGNYIDAMALVSKEAWATIGGYHHMQVAGWEDYDFWCRLAEYGLAGAWHVDVLALYRVHGTSMLQKHTMVPANYRRLAEEFTKRHPWVSLMTEPRRSDDAIAVPSSAHVVS
jgi:GT2 family glycosyltransferase/glycosyltransferase involved in cell wall biosynthesis